MHISVTEDRSQFRLHKLYPLLLFQSSVQVACGLRAKSFVAELAVKSMQVTTLRDELVACASITLESRKFSRLFKMASHSVFNIAPTCLTKGAVLAQGANDTTLYEASMSQNGRSFQVSTLEVHAVSPQTLAV